MLWQDKMTFVVWCMLTLIVAPAQGQRPLPKDSALLYAQLPIHGVSMIPASVRHRVLGDSDALNEYAQLLQGRQESGRQWDTTVVLWWLAETGQAKYAPLFLRYADATAPHRLALVQMALYGLARTAALDASASRLRGFAQHERPIVRQMTIAALLAVNDTLTRGLIREIPRERVPVAQQQAVLDALATPALSRGEGHLFCQMDEVHAVSSAGRYQCVPRTAALSPTRSPHAP